MDNIVMNGTKVERPISGGMPPTSSALPDSQPIILACIELLKLEMVTKWSRTAWHTVGCAKTETRFHAQISELDGTAPNTTALGETT